MIATRLFLVGETDLIGAAPKDLGVCGFAQPPTGPIMIGQVFYQPLAWRWVCEPTPLADVLAGSSVKEASLEMFVCPPNKARAMAAQLQAGGIVLAPAEAMDRLRGSVSAL